MVNMAFVWVCQKETHCWVGLLRLLAPGDLLQNNMRHMMSNMVLFCIANGNVNMFSIGYLVMSSLDDGFKSFLRLL